MKRTSKDGDINLLTLFVAFVLFCDWMILASALLYWWIKDTGFPPSDFWTWAIAVFGGETLLCAGIKIFDKVKEWRNGD